MCCEKCDEFKKELTELVNKHSMENGSDTPDFILARFLKGCLELFNKTIKARQHWYSNDAKPAGLPETEQDIPMPEVKQPGSQLLEGLPDWPKPEVTDREEPVGTKVSDYLDEFITALREQLDNDHRRWGLTWMKRTRAGQEQRTKERFDDYFDQYFNAGVPINWLKVVGGAFINWIRDNHPEVCPDITLVGNADGNIDACTCPKVTEPTIKALGHDGECDDKKDIIKGFEDGVQQIDNQMSQE